MKYTLRTRLVLSFAAVSMISIMLISILANFFLDKQFKDYVIKRQETRNLEVVRLIGEYYSEGPGWNVEAIVSLGINELSNGIILKVKDIAGNTVWDATEYNLGLCDMMMSRISDNMMTRYPGWHGEYIEKEYPLNVNLNRLGTVTVGFHGPYFFNDADLSFITTLNKALIFVTVFSLALSLILASIIAQGLTKPIKGVIERARMIAKGDYGIKDVQISSIKEIDNLIYSINDLSNILENQQNLRKRLTTDMAHELRTPMATLQSHFEAMIDGIWQPTPERLQSCHQEVIRINKMIGNLEKLAKYEEENIILNKEKFDISKVLANIIMNFEGEALKKGLSIKYNFKTQIFFGDKDKLSQVIINLISNALEHSKDGGKIQIETVEGEMTNKIIITDDGHGISKEDLPHIFERLYRADKSRSTATGGRGVGLSISKAIVESHGGTIEVKSTLGQGSEFTIVLPVSRI